MARCQFIYLARGSPGSVSGGQCNHEGQYVNGTLCSKHKHKRTIVPQSRRQAIALHNTLAFSTSADVGPISNKFPRVARPDEIQKWVESARAATDPVENLRRPCVFCGRSLHLRQDLVATINKDHIRHFQQINRHYATQYYRDVPPQYFFYSALQSESDLNLKVPLCRSAFFEQPIPTNRDESQPIAYGCHECLRHISKNKLPPQSLANGIWTGASEIPELSGLTFIEEKLLARVHVSINLFKCRIFHRMSADKFYSQPQLRGHITSYPVDPQVVAAHLPIAIDKLLGLIKVIFVSSRKVKFAEVCQLYFFLVRRNRVETALRWLISHNPLYRDVTIDGATLERLPISGMIPELFVESGLTFRTDLDDASHSRYDQPDQSGSECSEKDEVSKPSQVSPFSADPNGGNALEPELISSGILS